MWPVQFLAVRSAILATAWLLVLVFVVDLVVVFSDLGYIKPPWLIVWLIDWLMRLQRWWRTNHTWYVWLSMLLSCWKCIMTPECLLAAIFVRCYRLTISSSFSLSWLIVLSTVLYWDEETMASNESFLPARRYASAGNSDRNQRVCPSVRPSVCLSRAGIVSKRRKLATWFLHHLVASRL